MKDNRRQRRAANAGDGAPRRLEPVAALPSGKRQLHLTGFMGSGKSTVGQWLARRLLWNYLDLDAVIERQAGKSVAQIFADSGEDGFRKIEAEALRAVVSKPLTVIALGGGTLIAEDNRSVCAGAADVVWLDSPLEQIERRCAGGAARPLWGSREELEARLDARLSGYRAAGLLVDAGGAPDAVATAVLCVLGVRDR